MLDGNSFGSCCDNGLYENILYLVKPQTPVNSYTEFPAFDKDAKVIKLSPPTFDYHPQTQNFYF